MLHEHVITVFGSGDPAKGSEAYEQARAVGRVLAELGYTIANGGYGGTMEASARGAHEAGGQTIAVPCSIWSSKPREEYFSEIRTTACYDERLARLIELGNSGYVALPGATGTLVELAWVWEHACKGFSKMAVRPIACVGSFWQPLLEMMVAQRPRAADYVRLAEHPEALAEIFPAADPDARR
jgi:hypothetical protein